MNRVDKIFKTLKKLISFEPVINKLAKKNASHFEILIATMMSARTKDEVTELAAKRLFAIANTANKVLKLKQSEIEKLIYPVGFYKTKAKNIIKLSELILKDYAGKVPKDLESLMKLPGIGLKTASLVLSEAFALDEICVDTHVHRIANRLDLVRTINTTQTYNELKRSLAKKYWRIINYYFVSYGKTVCKPVNPSCKLCKINKLCKKHGVNPRYL